MLKKTLAAVALAGALILGTAAAASAGTYPDTAPVTAASPTITVGGSTVITATGLGDRDTVTFAHNAGASGSIASIAFASASTTSVDKSVTAGTASATFSASAPGTYTVSVLDGSAVLGSVQVTVAAAGSGSDASGGGLPDTGGAIPVGAVWLGVGVIGLGGIALAAVSARRRTQKS